MGREVESYFEDLIDFVEQHFSNTQILKRDTTNQRSLLELNAWYGKYRIVISEIFLGSQRKYAYYVLEGARVCIGFDNSPDITVIRLKYPSDYQSHRFDLIPHVHSADKKSVALAQNAITLQAFYEWIQHNLSPENADQ